jgi:hypothetical protein
MLVKSRNSDPKENESRTKALMANTLQTVSK